MHRASPVSMVDSEPAVMSEFSSDTDPDMEDELCRFQPLPAPVLPTNASMRMVESPSHYPASTNASMRMVESPSHYPASAVPVVSSAVSSVRVSTGRDREVNSSVMLDVVLPPGDFAGDTSII